MFDFVMFPILWSIVQVAGGGRVESQWSPITLQGAGLFHMAMGAVLGVAAFGRTQEKLAGANIGGLPTPQGGVTAPSVSTPNGFGTPSTASSFGGGGFGGSFTTTPSGKTVVPAGPQPEL